MALEDQFEYLMREGDRADVISAMLKYRWHCESRGMSPERIEEEFASLVNRTLHSMRKQNGTLESARTLPPKAKKVEKSKPGVIHWGFHGKVPMDINESDSLRKRLGDDEFIRCTHFMDDFIFRNGDTRQWSKDFAAAVLRCSQEKWYDADSGTK